MEERLELVNSLASQTQLAPKIRRTKSPTVNPIVPEAKPIQFNTKNILKNQYNGGEDHPITKMTEQNYATIDENPQNHVDHCMFFFLWW